jgi:hypothetical protein
VPRALLLAFEGIGGVDALIGCRRNSK